MKKNQPPQDKYSQDLLVENCEKWMVIALSGAPGKETAQPLVIGVSQATAKAYTQGFNKHKKSCAKTRVRAVLCRCQ